MAFVCKTEVAQDTFGMDCGVSCTGLYADVTFTEDAVLKTKEIPFTADYYGDKVNIKRVETNKGKKSKRQKLVQLLNKYTDYKKSFVKQIRFDPDSSNLSEYMYKQIKI